MTSADTRVNDLVVNVMTKEQFEKITPQDNQLYLTPDEDQEWQKPADWIDIRSGAFENSVYLLVGHSADYSSYPQFSVFSNISNSGTYDIYVDGIKQATTESGTETVLTWQNLALETGWDVTYPAALRTHIVRVTPSVPSDKIVGIRLNQTASYSENVSGVLWAHFSLDYAIDIQRFAGSAYRTIAPILETITAKNNLLKVTACNTAFRKSSLKHFATTLDYSNSTGSTNELFMDCSYLQGVVTLKNLSTTLSSGFYNRMFQNATVEKIVFDGGCVQNLFYVFDKCKALKEIKGAIPSNSNCSTIYWTENTSYEKPLYLYFSQISNAEHFDLQKNPMLKGLTVSNEAPFTGASPQINVSNTGLNREALVNLFKSMPYNVGYTVVGSPTITDGVASGFSDSNYLKTDTTFSQAVYNAWIQNSETVVKFRTNALQAQHIVYIPTGGGYAGFYMRGSQGKINWQIYSTSYRISPDFVFSVNTDYWLKGTIRNGVATFSYSTDGTNYTTLGTLDLQGITDPGSYTSYVQFGYGSAELGPVNGSIDLNNTYIKVNGVPWFTGKAAMTKTCSIVGCTGTADLTQADKDIALDKGWSLTVA